MHPLGTDSSCPRPLPNASSSSQQSILFVRFGESEFERLSIINTNPVAKTSVDSGLSELGKKQTVRAALASKEMGACSGNCWIWPSITQRVYQAAEVIAAVTGIDRR